MNQCTKMHQKCTSAPRCTKSTVLHQNAQKVHTFFQNAPKNVIMHQNAPKRTSNMKWDFHRYVFGMPISIDRYTDYWCRRSPSSLKDDVFWASRPVRAVVLRLFCEWQSFCNMYRKRSRCRRHPHPLVEPCDSSDLPSYLSMQQIFSASNRFTTCLTAVLHLNLYPAMISQLTSSKN